MQANKNNLRTLPLILYPEGLDLEASCLTTLSLSFLITGTKGAESKPWRGGFAGEPVNGTLGLEANVSKAMGSYLNSHPPNLL